jgi:hypothetical protein
MKSHKAYLVVYDMCSVIYCAIVNTMFEFFRCTFLANGHWIFLMYVAGSWTLNTSHVWGWLLDTGYFSCTSLAHGHWIFLMYVTESLKLDMAHERSERCHNPPPPQLTPRTKCLNEILKIYKRRTDSRNGDKIFFFNVTKSSCVCKIIIFRTNSQQKSSFVSIAFLTLLCFHNNNKNALWSQS